MMKITLSNDSETRHVFHNATVADFLARHDPFARPRPAQLPPLGERSWIRLALADTLNWANS